MAFKLRSSNPLATPLTWTEMDNNLIYLLTNLSGSNISITGSTGIKGSVTVSGSATFNNISTFNNTASFNNLYPILDIAYDLGKSNVRFNNAYIKNAVLSTVTASFISGSITNAITSSFSNTSSYVLNSISSSYATSASSILNGAAGYLPFWSSSTQLSSSAVRYLNIGFADEIRITSVTVNMPQCGLIQGISNQIGTSTYAHAEGGNTQALGLGSHTEGVLTVAYSTGSHAEGLGTKASASYQHASGKYNIPDGSDQTLFLIGNGTGIGTESTAFKVRQSGSIVIQTGSAAPTWVGQEGEIKPVKNGSALLLYCYINGAWHSASLA